MSKIVSRSYSKEGLNNWDKIFGKNKKVKQVNSIISNEIPLHSECEECHRLDGTHDQDCRNYL